MPELAALIDVALRRGPTCAPPNWQWRRPGESAKWERQQTYDFIGLCSISMSPKATIYRQRPGEDRARSAAF